MAELLVRAVDPKVPFENGTRKGDIIVVRPDGHKWGSMECLPEYLVVKVSEKYDDVKHYEQSLMDTTDAEKPVLLKYRKHYLDLTELDTKALEVKDMAEITPALTTSNKVSAKGK